MDAHTPEQVEALKRDMYDRLSKRQKKYVDRIGYEVWEPFQLPNDPLDIRRNETGYTAQELALLYFRDREKAGLKVNEHYKSSVNEFALQLIAQTERCRPIVEFCQWYGELMRKTGTTF
ncbi:MAG: hypothetical protein KKB70_01295 [Proteobacteria bacterium]|nr:hypothetical protein [Pseudomonadota bacterium]MBU1611855.1 hypothetical protein [Pseudomonadota bacterium]